MFSSFHILYLYLFKHTFLTINQVTSVLQVSVYIHFSKGSSLMSLFLHQMEVIILWTPIAPVYTFLANASEFPMNLARFGDFLGQLKDWAYSHTQGYDSLRWKGTKENQWREKGRGVKSRGNQEQSSKIFLPVESYRMCFIHAAGSWTTMWSAVYQGNS